MQENMRTERNIKQILQAKKKCRTAFIISLTFIRECVYSRAYVFNASKGLDLASFSKRTSVFGLKVVEKSGLTVSKIWDRCNNIRQHTKNTFSLCFHPVFMFKTYLESKS